MNKASTQTAVKTAARLRAENAALAKEHAALVSALHDALNYIDYAGREDDGELTDMAEDPFNKGKALLAQIRKRIQAL
jgi:hypothetical protein